MRCNYFLYTYHVFIISMKETTKEEAKKKLFEVMEKVAGLPPMNENSYESLDTDTISGDVQNVKNLGSPAVKNALKRINTQREFNEAFESWFNGLGFDDPNKKSKIRIATSVTHISEVLKNKGIKY
jgi:hypothetical protein